MRLRPWVSQPESPVVLAVCTGEASELEQFADTWLEYRGTLNLLGCRGEITRSTASEETFKSQAVVVIWLGLVPNSFVLAWIAKRADWLLFHRPLAADESAEGGSGVPAVGGNYTPWGGEFETSPPPCPATDLRVFQADGPGLRIPVEQMGDYFALIGATPSLTVLNGTPPTTPLLDYVLPLELRPAGSSRPTDAQGSIDRWSREIIRLQELVEDYRWLEQKPQPPVWMYVYPETGPDDIPYLRSVGGSVWALRRWYAEATDAALAQFQHARCAFPKPIGTLHFLIPNPLLLAPSANPPEGRYRLALDHRWYQFGPEYRLFVPEGLELWPPPPRPNTHLWPALSRCMWGSPPDGTLVLLPAAAGTPFHPLRVPGFAPLANQQVELNLGIPFRFRSSIQSQGDIGTLLERVRKDAEKAVEEHAAELAAALEDLRKQHIDSLEPYREDLRKAMESVKSLRVALDGIATFRRNVSGEWDVFVGAVLEQDRELIRDPRVESLVARFDHVRADLSRLGWLSPPQTASEVAARLDEVSAALASALRDFAAR